MNITSTRLEYLGAVKVVSGKEYLSTDLSSLFAGATTFIMKSKGNIVNGIREQIQVSIDNTLMFSIEYNEINTFDPTISTPLKFKFSQDCVIVVAKEMGSL